MTKSCARDYRVEALVREVENLRQMVRDRDELLTEAQFGIETLRANRAEQADGDPLLPRCFTANGASGETDRW